jgi:hypothetical protein
MFSFKWQSCCGERAGSHINMTKTKSRTGLRAETFDSIIFNTFNMPFLNEMDSAAFVKLWGKEGHQMGTAKEGIKSEICVDGCASPPSNKDRHVSLLKLRAEGSL